MVKSSYFQNIANIAEKQSFRVGKQLQEESGWYYKNSVNERLNTRSRNWKRDMTLPKQKMNLRAKQQTSV